jgi:4-hydroxy-tetrahydrodipicolinate synthase
MCRRAERRTLEPDRAFRVLSSRDESPDLVLYDKLLMVLDGPEEYALHLNADDARSDSRRNCADAQWARFKTWYGSWKPGGQ